MTMHATARANEQQPANPTAVPFALKPSRTPVQLSPQQYAKLVEPLHEARVGQDGKGFDHVEAWDIEATLTRIFGFGMWTSEVVAEECVAQQEINGKWAVSWRIRMRLTAYDPQGNPLGPWENGTIETGTQGKLSDAHELAYKSAISGALKRCAKAMGNQFGLSLYAGRTGAHPRLVAVKATLNPPPMGHGIEQAPAPAPDESTVVEEVAALRREAADAGLDPEDVDDAMLQAYGHALDDASADEVAKMRAVIREGMAA